jgi:hypothetical protein
MLGIWAMAVLALIVFGALTGDTSPREALTVGLGFLPLAIPLAPFTWLHFDPRPRQAREAREAGEAGEAGRARAFPNVGFGCLWAVLTMPLAIGLSLFLTRLVGGE